jgi:hypothetical protein
VVGYAEDEIGQTLVQAVEADLAKQLADFGNAVSHRVYKVVTEIAGLLDQLEKPVGRHSEQQRFLFRDGAGTLVCVVEQSRQGEHARVAGVDAIKAEFPAALTGLIHPDDAPKHHDEFAGGQVAMAEFRARGAAQHS